MHEAQRVAMVVRHRDALGLAGAHALAADHDRDLDRGRGLARELGFQRAFLGAARRIALDRFVDRMGDFEDAVSHGMGRGLGAA